MMSPRVQIPGVGLNALDARYVNVTGDTMIGALTVPDLTIGSLAGVLKASSGVVSGSATTTDLPEGTNLYFTTARARTSLSATSPVTYNSSTGVIAFDTATTTLTAYHKLTGDTGTGTYNVFPSSDVAALVLKAGGTSTSIKTFELQDSAGNPWFYIRKRLLSDANSGTVYDFTTSGSGGTIRTGLVVNLAAGYTGGEFTGALAFDNAVAGTATYYLADATTYGYRPGGNRGFGGFARGVTTGHNIGGMVLAGGGAINYGLWASATITKGSAVNVGVFANAHNASGTAPAWIGLYATCFNTNLTTPPNMAGVKTALLADNQTFVCDIAIFRDNGTPVWTIPDGGSLTAGDGINMIFGTSTGTKIGTATTQKIGFWNVTPVVQPSAYTQTFATANKTIAAYTSDPESAAYTGIDNVQLGTVYATVADLNLLRAAYEVLRAHAEDIGEGLNAVIDDLQAIGLVA